MIARIWHGKTTSEKADEYLKDYFLKTGLADYLATEGNLGVVVLRRDVDGIVDFQVLTFWKSRDAIKSFAGDDIEQARYYPEDEYYFAEREPKVAHYEVVLQFMQELNQG